MSHSISIMFIMMLLRLFKLGIKRASSVANAKQLSCA